MHVRLHVQEKAKAERELRHQKLELRGLEKKQNHQVEVIV